MIMQLVRLWGLRVPLSWYFGFSRQLGSRGIWIGMLISNVLSAVLALVLLATVDWHHKVIEHAPSAEEAVAGVVVESVPVPSDVEA